MDNDDKQLRNPIHFVESEYKRKPLRPFGRFINGQHKFAITAETANGKFVRSGFLFYNLNGVEIYAPLNSILMINTEDNTVFIRTDKNLSDSIGSSDPESIEYVILYSDIGYDSDDFEPYRWVKIVGRSSAYRSIKDNASLINVDESFIIADSVSLKEALSVREFCEYLKNANVLDDDDFDINNYAGTDYI